jgi:hypothetical protein
MSGEGVEMGPNARVWHRKVGGFHTVGCLEALSLYMHRVTHDACTLHRADMGTIWNLDPDDILQ